MPSMMRAPGALMLQSNTEVAKAFTLPLKHAVVDNGTSLVVVA